MTSEEAQRGLVQWFEHWLCINVQTSSSASQKQHFSCTLHSHPLYTIPEHSFVSSKLPVGELNIRTKQFGQIIQFYAHRAISKYYAKHQDDYYFQGKHFSLWKWKHASPHLKKMERGAINTWEILGKLLTSSQVNTTGKNCTLFCSAATC